MLKAIFLVLFTVVGQFTLYASGYSVVARTSEPHPVYIDGATKIIDLILETVGLRASFEVRKANVPNAAAVVYGGKRYILYNPSFIVAMDKAAGTPWASVAVLAHEIGHHLIGHTLDGKGSLPAIELEADEFSGFALRKLGASLPEAQIAMRIIASAKATRTHPGRTDRLMAIAAGWKLADEQIAQSTTAPGASGRGLQSKDIMFDVHFDDNTEGRYYVLAGNDLVQVLNGQLRVLGELVVTRIKAYPLAIHTISDGFLLIGVDGDIIDEQGNTIGSIAPHT